MQGQRVVALGGTSGIGLAVALGSEKAGASVTVASSRPSSVERALARLGPHASGQVVDVLDPVSVEMLFGTVGPFDHLVYTAGEPLTTMPIGALDLGRARAFFEARYFGVLASVHAAVRHIRHGGSITLTSGTVGERPGPGWSLGASVCGAVNALTRALAIELAPVRVNAVSPGVTRSQVWSEMDQDDREAMYDELARSLPAGRVGEVEDAAEAYLYCMNQSHTTGIVLTVDGGTVLV